MTNAVLARQNERVREQFLANGADQLTLDVLYRDLQNSETKRKESGFSLKEQQESV